MHSLFRKGATMNLDDAIKAHSNWKIKLQDYLKNPDGSIDHQALSKDNLCALGVWLYGDGLAAHGHLAEFKALVDEHKLFHQAASEIVVRKNKGDDVAADVALGGDSPFARHSAGVVSLIMKMKKAIGV